MRSATEKSEGDLPVFIKWHEFLTWLFLATERFPKKARFTLSERLIQLGLEVMEDLVEARYTKDKVRILQRANLRLEKVRVLVRISYEQKFLSHDGYKVPSLKVERFVHAKMWTNLSTWIQRSVPVLV